jgi:hypothetical protein
MARAMDWLKLAHIGLAMILVAGMIGRWIILRWAGTSEEVESSARLAELSAPVRKDGCCLVVVDTPGRSAHRSGSGMNDARARATMPPELRAAFADPAVRAARTFEVVGIGAVVALMVLKPTL